MHLYYISTDPKNSLDQLNIKTLSEIKKVNVITLTPHADLTQAENLEMHVLNAPSSAYLGTLGGTAA